MLRLLLPNVGHLPFSLPHLLTDRQLYFIYFFCPTLALYGIHQFKMAPPFFSNLAKGTTDLLTNDYGNYPQ